MIFFFFFIKCICGLQYDAFYFNFNYKLRDFSGR